MEDLALMRELKEYEAEKAIREKELENERKKYAEMLKGEMGTDIHNVLNGNTIVKLSSKEKFQYKIKNIKQKISSFIDNFFNTF